jgi:predicted aspartyl protease
VSAPTWVRATALLAVAACARTPTVIPEPRVAVEAPIEIELAKGAVPTVVATVDGHPGLVFLVDTGASMSCVNLSAARELGLPVRPYASTGRTTGSDGRSAEYESYVPMSRIEIGPLAIEDLHVPAFDSEVLAVHGWFGLLGQDVLGKMIFVVDAERGRLHALPPSTDMEGLTRYLKDAKLGAGGWGAVPVEFRPCPHLALDVAEPVGGQVVLELDTGATWTSLPKSLVRGLALEEAGTYEAHTIAGRHAGRTYKLRGLDLFGIKISGEIEDSDLDHGLFGMDILGKLVVVFDAPHGKVWFHNRVSPPATAPVETEAEAR